MTGGTNVTRSMVSLRDTIIQYVMSAFAAILHRGNDFQVSYKTKKGLPPQEVNLQILVFVDLRTGNVWQMLRPGQNHHRNTDHNHH